MKQFQRLLRTALSFPPATRLFRVQVDSQPCRVLPSFNRGFTRGQSSVPTAPGQLTAFASPVPRTAQAPRNTQVPSPHGRGWPVPGILREAEGEEAVAAAESGGTALPLANGGQPCLSRTLALLWHPQTSRARLAHTDWLAASDVRGLESPTSQMNPLCMKKQSNLRTNASDLSTLQRPCVLGGGHEGRGPPVLLRQVLAESSSLWQHKGGGS